jgi:hypothetical protein
MSRPLQVFAATLCIAALVSVAMPIQPAVYWCFAAGAAFLVAFLARKPGSPRSLGGGEFLCDDCKYNNEKDCWRAERPNAVRCPDYKRRG